MYRNILRYVVCSCLVAIGSVHATDGMMTGSGTEADPFLVADYNDLKAIGTAYSINAVYRVIADIDASPSSTEDSSRGFKPIGTYATPFTGVFHGSGHVIRGIYIYRGGYRYIGLFGYAHGCAIDSIGLTGVSILGGQYTGVLAGYTDSCTMTGCYAIGSVSGTSSSGVVGGLVGENYHQSTISGCHTGGSVSDFGNFTGGLVGLNYDSCTINGCYTTATVSGPNVVGGLIGGNGDTSLVIGCHATGPVSNGTGTDIGGLIGQNSKSIVSGCYATGSVTSTGSRVGGLIGYNEQSCTVNGCYATGAVTGKGSSVGGLIGDNWRSCTVSGCHSTGSVSVVSVYGVNGVGGLVGYNEYSSSVIDCYATGAVFDSNSNTSYSGSGAGGLVGTNYGSKVYRCYATGSVAGNAVNVGGLVGDNDMYGSIISSYATAQVSGRGEIGGLVGYNRDTSTVVGCYAAGKVSGGSYIGGFAGENDYNRSTISDCYWDRETSGQSYGVGYGAGTLTGLSTGQMKRQATFSGWAFDTLWTIREDSTYPGLRTLDNAPFAFIDTIGTQRTLSLSSFLANDCDVETIRNSLTLRVLTISAGTTDSVSSFSFPAGAVYGDTASLSYRIGEIRSGDTLWGNRSKAFLYFDNISSVATPKLVSPANASINLPISLLPLVWTQVSAATTYHITIATDSNFKSIFLEDSTITDTTLTLNGLPNYATYYWRVRAKDGAGVSQWTTSRRFRTIPLPPPSPVLVSPADGTLGMRLSPTFRWNRSLAAEKYYIQVASDTGFTSLLVDSTRTDTIFFSLRGDTYLTTYYWRVRAENVSGISNWSGYWSYTTNMPRPTLVSPADSVTNQPVSLTLIWDTVSTAVSYHVQVSTDRYFGTVFMQDSTITDTVFSVSGLANGTTYYWRVQAKDAGGYVSGFATRRQFSTIALPHAPTLVFPFNGITDMPDTLPLIWDTVSTATSYHVQVATDTGFTNLFLQDSALTDTMRPVSGLSRSTIYYWRVRGKNAGGAGAWSSYWSFTTVLGAPAAPVLVYPLNGTVDQPVSLSLGWNKVSTATGYHIQVATDTGFTSLFTQDSTLTDSLKSIIGLANSATYYWRVRAKNAGGAGAWSNYWSLTTIIAPSGVPTLVSPASMAVDQPVSLTLVWNRVSTATSYNFQVATDTGFTSLFTQDSTVTDSLKAISGLANSTMYYWRVRAKNAGGVSAWSSTRSFTTIVALPSAVVILAPADSAIIDVDSVRLSWSRTLPAVDRYLVEVATDTNMTVLVINDSSVADTTRLLTSLVNNTTYYWRAKAHNAAGWGGYSSEKRFVTSFTGVLFNGNSIRVFSLKYKAGTLLYTLPKQCFVSVKYYDIRGRMIASYLGRMQGAGSYSLRLPTWGTGAYIQVFTAGEIVRKDRLMVIK